MFVFNAAARYFSGRVHITHDVADFQVATRFDGHGFVVAALGLVATSPTSTLSSHFHELVRLTGTVFGFWHWPRLV